jgi:phosphoglycerate dehydrogenase-like enzyme
MQVVTKALNNRSEHSPKKYRPVGIVLDNWERKIFFPECPGEVFGRRIEWITEMKGPSFWDRLEVLGPEVVVTGWHSPLFDKNALKRIPSLRYICHVPGSVRHVVTRGFIEQGGIVSNWGGSVSHMVAEHALLLILACLRDLSRWQEFIALRDKNSEVGLLTRTLFKRKVGIHGMGAVARHLIKLLAPFDADISAYSDGVPLSVYQSAGVKGADSLDSLFSNSEVLVECEALTPASRGSVNRSLLERMKYGAIFVNVGRGALVDEPVLLEFAAKGRLRLGLDVLGREPVRLDDPALRTRGVIVSPHIAGPTQDRLRACGEWAWDNLIRYFEGKPLQGQVTLAIYDRST